MTDQTRKLLNTFKDHDAFVESLISDINDYWPSDSSKTMRRFFAALIDKGRCDVSELIDLDTNTLKKLQATIEAFNNGKISRDHLYRILNQTRPAIQINDKKAQIIVNAVDESFGEKVPIYLFGARVNTSVEGLNRRYRILIDSSDFNSEEAYKYEQELNFYLECNLEPSEDYYVVRQNNKNQPRNLVSWARDEGIDLRNYVRTI